MDLEDFKTQLQDFLLPCHFFSCINTLYSLFVRMHMEEVNRLIQFFFITKTLTKISNGLRTYCVYDRVPVANKICPKDKRRRLLFPRESHRLKSSPRLNTYMNIPKLPPGSNRIINGVRYTGWFAN